MGTKCVIRPSKYFYVSKFNAGQYGILPHNFILNGSTDVDIINYSHPDDYTFDWYNLTNSSIRTERKYSKSENNIIINTNDATFEFLFLDEKLPVSPNINEMVSLLIIPWYANTRVQLLNIKTMGEYDFKFIKLFNNHLELIQSDSFIPDSNGYSDRTSCPLIINGTTTIFGGQSEEKQISIIYPIGIQRIGSLPFRFRHGQCTWTSFF